MYINGSEVIFGCTTHVFVHNMKMTWILLLLCGNLPRKSMLENDIMYVYIAYPMKFKKTNKNIIR